MDSFVKNEIINFKIPELVKDGDILISENTGLLDKHGKRGNVYGVVKLVPPKLSNKKKEAIQYIISYSEK